MKELTIDAVDQCEAAFCRNAAALNQQVAAVIRDGYHRLDIAVAVEIECAVVAGS